MTVRSPLDDYRWREMLQDATEGAEEALREGVQTAYAGFDPTAPSLHVGNLVPVMGLVHFQRAGHAPIALVGGATALIGDPSGKDKERPLLSREEAEANAGRIRGQLEAFLDFGDVSNSARMVNNLDWLGPTSVLDFLRDVGKHFPVSVMLGKEAIRTRLENETVGISFTEFSYILLQSYDFYRLFEDRGCRFQLGGSDQWGNITAGIDLIRRVGGEKAFGVVFPLLTTASGAKFGKTEEGAVWLDPELTSPYRFHQYWLNVDDADVGRCLRLFTLLDRTEIEALDVAAAERPQAREAQQALADDVTGRVHGEEALRRAKRASSVLFGGEVRGLAADEIEDIFSDVPSSALAADRLAGDGVDVTTLLADVGMTSSRGEARRSVEQGGIYLNGERVTDPTSPVRVSDALHGRFLVLRRGKKSYHLVRVEG
jgi:tyrosyl-tRNA synthetase